MMMDSKRVVIIGGGPGGYVAAIRSAQLGAGVTLIEKDRIGGTCLHRGCIPTKTLLHDAKILHSLKGSNVFRSIIPERFNPWRLMIDRKRKVVDDLARGVRMLLDSYGVRVKYARADFLENRELLLIDENGKNEILKADALIIATGSRSKILSNINPDGIKIITSDEALEITEIPGEMVILGGGYIGVEFATLFNLLGTKVTIVEILENILPTIEEELVRNLRRFMERDGIRIFTRSKIEEIHEKEEGLKIIIKTPTGIKELSGEKLLLATGRVPNIDIHYSKAGLEVHSNGIQVNKKMETAVSQIYAIGDVTGRHFLAHTAMQEGVVASENIMGHNYEIKDRLIPICIFTNPEIASIGLTEKEARERGEIKVGRFPFRSNPTAVICGEKDGFIKVVSSKESDEILGVHIIGHDASTLISLASSMMGGGGRVKDFSKLIQAHPTLPEAMREAMLDIDKVAIHLPKSLYK